MATYAVGDVQGCLDSLYALLKAAQFEPEKDELWLVGDLVNRGPQSLETLRFVKSLPKAKVVLGNHDLHLLAVSKGFKAPNKKDTLSPILDAEDREELLNWLQNQPLVYHDPELGFTMVHAGIPPMWSVNEALTYASEVQAALQTPDSDAFFANMYGNQPEKWHESLSGTDRWRVITNYFTRMRFCDEKGRLELKTKTGPLTAPEGYRPWFEHKKHRCKNDKILFGHWASLEGKSGNTSFIALDTGCVWGGTLSMLRLQDGAYFSVPNQQHHPD